MKSLKYLIIIFILSSVHAHSATTPKEIFEKYQNANNQGFKTGDTTLLKELYTGDVDSCWTIDKINYRGPITSSPIPADAKYTLTKLENSDYNPLRDSRFVFDQQPTHMLEISYEINYFSTCINSLINISNSILLYVKLNESDFSFPAVCPSREFLESRAKQYKSNVPNELSSALIKRLLKSLSEKEKNIIKLFSKEGSKYFNEVNKITSKHNIGISAFGLIEHELCKNNTNKKVKQTD